MLRFLFYIFLAYLLYRLVFGFILPIYRTTRQVRRGFREMQERMNAGASDPQSGRPSVHTSANEAGNSKVGDYIDFEEVK